MIELGIIGHPVAHSKSPSMHRAALAAAGIEGTYTPHDVSPDDLPHWIQSQRLEGLRGFNVTVPHKKAIASQCDRLDESAKAVGAVNTVLVHGDGTWAGFNTDVVGFSDDLRETAGFDPGGCTALVLGAGGAAAAVVVALQQAGAERVVLCNRTDSHALKMATSMNVQSCVFRGDALRDVRPDLVINATSCGLALKSGDEGWDEAVGFFDQLPVADWSKPTAYDLIYTPKQTAFLSRFDRMGCPTHHGLGMLVRQGAMSFQLWTGVPRKRVLETMEEIVSS